MNNHTQFPINWDPTPSAIKLLLKHNLTLAPGASDYVRVYPGSDVSPGEDLIIAESFDDTLEEDINDTYNIIPSVTSYDKNGIYHVLLKNDSDYHMTFATNTHIAEMQRVSRQNCFLQLQPLSGVTAMPNLCEEDEFYNFLLQKENRTNDQLVSKLYKMEKAKPVPMEQSDLVNDFDEAKAYRQDKSTNLYRKIKQNIDQSSYMNEDEKKQALEQFTEHGYYTQPASEVIDQNRKLLSSNITLNSLHMKNVLRELTCHI